MTDALLNWSEKMVKWLAMVAKHSDEQEQINRGRFDSLADACKFDAANYRKMEKDGRAAIAVARCSETECEVSDERTIENVKMPGRKSHEPSSSVQ